MTFFMANSDFLLFFKSDLLILILGASDFLRSVIDNIPKNVYVSNKILKIK